MAKQKSTNYLRIFALPKIASTIDVIAPKNAIASIVDAISGDCWTHNNHNYEINLKKKKIRNKYFKELIILNNIIF